MRFFCLHLYKRRCAGTGAEAVLGRLLAEAHKIELKGESPA